MTYDDDAQRFLLTDDEVVTVALLYRRPWPAPVATVDLESRDEVTSSLLRGRRSLVARGLMREVPAGAALDARLESLVDTALGAPPEMVVTVVDPARETQVAGVWLTAVPDGTGSAWAVVSAGPDGLQAIEQADRTAVRERVEGLVVEAVRDGVPGSAEGEALLSVNRRTAGEPRTLLARRGQAAVLGEEPADDGAANGRTVRDVLDEFWAEPA